MSAVWKLCLLGDLCVESAERRITRFRTEKTAALLAYLGYYADRTHARELLTELLWPEDEMEAARHKLRVALSSLRRQLEPPGIPAGAVIAAGRKWIRLNAAACATDVAAFERRLDHADKTASGVERVRLLAEAVACYRGELLPGFYEDWLLPERERLLGRYLRALRALIALQVADHDYEEALDNARRAVAAAPDREDTHRDLIRLLVATGQPAAALQQYAELERILGEEHGTTPSPATRALLDLTPAARPGSSEAPRRPDAPGRLPVSTGPAPQPPLDLAGSTLTFLLADVAGETAPAPHGLAPFFRKAIASHQGRMLKDAPGTLIAAFGRAAQALMCAIAIQINLATVGEADVTDPVSCPSSSVRSVGECEEDEEHPTPLPGRTPLSATPHRGSAEASPSPDAPRWTVRIALHTGELAADATTPAGPALERSTALLLAAHPSQILCSEETAVLARRSLAADVRLEELGLFQLQGATTAERLFHVLYREMPRPEFPPPRAGGGHVLHLPMSFTRFFGREEEMARIAALLLDEEVRLVTLTGLGGSGKTRLAVEVVRRMVTALRTPVWFVPLADLRDAERIPEAIQDAMHLPRLTDVAPLDQVVAALSRQPALLLLDNFEHLLANGATMVREALHRVPTLTCLVTSRQRLNLAGERELGVGPLPIPEPGGLDSLRGSPVGRSVVHADPTDLSDASEPERPNARTPEHLMQCPSVQLFVDRAQAMQPDFQITPSNAGALAALCCSLEGIPLALELAAARVQVLSPAQILARLSQRYELLVSRERDADVRHRTLRAAVEWSYRLLTPEVARFFGRLAVFRGGWTLEAAEAVCGNEVDSGLLAVVSQGTQSSAPTTDNGQRTTPNVLDALTQLRECSLIVVDDLGDVPRFRMLDTLREFATELLEEVGEGEEARRRHLQYYLTQAEAIGVNPLSATANSAWLDQVARDHDNHRAALERALASDWEAGLRLTSALAIFWQIRGYWQEASLWNERYLTQSAPVTLATRARALFVVGVSAWKRHDHARATSFLEESVRLHRGLGDAPGLMETLFTLASIVMAQGMYAHARTLSDEAMALATALEDPARQARVLGLQASLAKMGGRLPEARALWDQQSALGRALGDFRIVAGAEGSLGDEARDHEDYPQTRRYYERSLEARCATRNRLNEAYMLGKLGTLAFYEGEYARSRADWEASGAIARPLGERMQMALVMHGLGHLALRQGDLAWAGSLYAECLAAWKELGDPGYVALLLTSQAQLARERGDPGLAQRLYQEAAGLLRDLNDAPGTALVLDALGRTAITMGDVARARVCFGESRALRSDRDDPREALDSRFCLAELARAEGDFARARTLLEECEATYRAFAGEGLRPSPAQPVRHGMTKWVRTLWLDGLLPRRLLGGRRGIADALAGLGDVARAAGDLALARDYFGQELTIRRALGEKWETAQVLGTLGELAAAAGDAAAARHAYAESLALFTEMEALPGITRCRERLLALGDAPPWPPSARGIAR